MATEQSIQQTVEALLAEVVAAKNVLSDVRRETQHKGRPITAVLEDLDRMNLEMDRRTARISAVIDDMSKRFGRPGADFSDGGSERASAIGLLEARHTDRVNKADPEHPFSPGESDIEQATLAVRAIKHLFKTTTVETLPLDQRKALTSFALGASGFILPPEMSNTVLSCLVEQTDVSGLVGSTNISGPSIKFLVDNAQIDEALWACQGDCFSAARTKNLTEGLGELEIKPETLRYVLCAGRDLLEDADVDMETWALGKVNLAVRHSVSKAVMLGDGQGQPLGILHPKAGIPICETGSGTPASQFTWQDVVLLKYQVPTQWHANGKYFMNERTFGLMLTISDANGRPIMMQIPTAEGEYQIAGSPVVVVTWMPDVAPGATPIAFGDWKAVYMLVKRKAVSFQSDPYTAGFCVLLKFEARIGGSIVCPNAARLLRIR